MLYILTSFWVLRTPKAGRNSHFQRFSAKKLKKAGNLEQNFAKTRFFEFAPVIYNKQIYKCTLKHVNNAMGQTQ